jgi:UDP-N-acetylglucosamine 2-epimerase (non-hydrolysing)
LRRLGLAPVPAGLRHGVVVTAHRASNVDDPERLARLVSLVVSLAREVAPVTFPVHPRTRARLVEHGLLDRLSVGGVRLLPPLPYEEMLRLMARSLVVVTDSGGLQEEASYFGVPVVVLRRSTPRWEGVAAGTSVLVGLDGEAALAAAARLCSAESQERAIAGSEAACPYGDGHTAERVTELLLDDSTWDLLRLDEPDLTGWLPGLLPIPASAEGA